MARKGAPPAGHIISGPPSPSIDVLTVDARGRICLPSYGRSHIAWLYEAHDAVQILFTLGPEPLVEIHEWNSAGELIQQELTTAEEARALTYRERYLAGSIERSGRLHLPPLVMHHLKLSGATPKVTVVMFADHVELWEETYRLERIISGPA